MSFRTSTAPGDVAVATALEDWFSSAVGEAPATIEGHLLGTVLPDLFGYHIVQLGCHHGAALTGSSRIGHQVLIEREGRLQWCDARAGDYVRVPGATPHAHRNASDRPAVDLIITTARMGEFFREVGRPVGAPPPTAREVADFVATAARYGYRLGTPGENAAVGITMPAFASEDL